MTTVADNTMGEQLADSLLQGVDNEQMRAATKLLGRHQDGYWLRRFLSEEESEAGPFARIDRAGTQPSINWFGVATHLIGNTVGGALTHTPIVGSRSELAVLSIASSLAGGTPVELREVLAPLDDGELRLVLRALQEATYSEDAQEH
ncbi:hypothetical protein ACH4FX_41905 [Streptomyces sp. NPDC018019]|uniref:hypothetical protein n=1 Tax=Streptomyces sp. NPDC018019 TaxID=3365030 RepID=UPI0037B36E0F